MGTISVKFDFDYRRHVDKLTTVALPRVGRTLTNNLAASLFLACGGFSNGILGLLVKSHVVVESDGSPSSCIVDESCFRIHADFFIYVHDSFTGVSMEVENAIENVLDSHPNIANPDFAL